MFRDLCKNICLNKNILMLVTAGVYILALYAVLSGHLLSVAGSITLLFIILVITEYVKPKYILIWAFIFYIGVINTSFRLKTVDELVSLAPVNCEITGQIVSIPQAKGDNKQRFFFKVNKIESDNMVREFENEKTLVTLNTNEKLRIYDYYKMKGRLTPPFKVGNPSQFDYGNYLRNFSVYAVFYGAKDSVPIRLNKTLPVSQKFLQMVNDYREKIIDIHSQTLNTPNLEILGGIVFGDDAIAPPDNIKQSFINSGLLHILAASGMNVAFIFSFFFFFLSLFKINYKVNIIFCMWMVLLYSLMTGLGASVIRAASMLIFVLLGKLIDRDANSIALLAFVAFLMLLYNPMYLNNVGFQLSFITTFGLLIMTPFLVKNKNKIVNWIIGTISIPIIAQLWVMPIQIFYFNNISLYSVFANIAIIPVLSLVSFAGFISSMLAVINSIADKVCIAADFLLNPFLVYIVNVADFFANLPYAIMYLKKPSIFQIILYFIILLIIIFSLKYKIKNRFIAISLSFLIFILLASFIPLKNNKTEIIFFAVGNADAILIKSPEEKYFLIDSGKYPYASRYSQAKNIILKYLTDKGVKEIDSFVITHFDSDHSGGSIDLMKNLKINKIYISDNSEDTNLSSKIISYIDNNKLNKQIVSNRQEIYKEKGFKILLIKPKGENILTENQQSIITMLVTENMNVLFMGDGDKNSYKALPEEFKNNIKIIKIGHHGALNSLDYEMISDINVAVISTGANVYNHPHPETVNLLKSYNKQILRTDYHNAVKIVIDNDKCMYYLYSPRYKRFISGDYIVRP